MINKYLSYLHEEKEPLNEFFVLSIILLINSLYKKYAENKKILMNCVGKTGEEKRKCFLVHKILGIKKTISEIEKLKSRCKSTARDVSKCIKGIDKEITKLMKEIESLKIKLAKI